MQTRPDLRHHAARRLPGARTSRFTLDDKLRIAERLDELGIHYIEGGWPGSNPRDEEFFRGRARARAAARHASPPSARPRRAGVDAADGPQPRRMLLRAETPVVTIVGKTWDLHVRDDLRIPLEENLEVIARLRRATCASASTR